LGVKGAGNGVADERGWKDKIIADFSEKASSGGEKWLTGD